MLPLCIVIPTNEGWPFPCFSDVCLYRSQLPQSEGSLGLKSQAPTLFAVKAPSHAILLSSAGPQIWTPPAGSPLVCPASLLHHPSRGWAAGPVTPISSAGAPSWELTVNALPGSQAACAVGSHCHAQRTRLGCPHWWNDPARCRPEAPQIKPPGGKAGEGEGWEAEGCTLPPLLPRDTFTLQHPGNWKEGVLGLNKSETLTSEVCANASAWFFCSMWVSLWVQVSTQNSKQNCWNHRLLQNLRPK